MIIVIGLIILVVALILAAVGVQTNMDATAHPGGNFAIFGQHLSNPSSGQIFLYGTLVGIAVALGMSILYWALMRRLSARKLRRELKDARNETSALRADLDRISQQLDNERADRRRIDEAKTVRSQPETPVSERIEP